MVQKIQVKTFSPHPCQDEVLASDARFKIMSCGRRFGKGNTLLRAIGTDALHNPGSVFWIISPNYSYTQPMWDKAIMAFTNVKINGKNFMKRPKVRDRVIPLYNGARIEFKSAIEPHTLRGAGDLILGIAFDEAAYCDPIAWKSVRPALMDNKAWAYFMSTPSAIQPKNWFYDMFIQGQENVRSTCDSCLGGGCPLCGNKGYTLVPNRSKHPDYQSWQFSSYQNPYIDNDEIDDMIAEFGWSELDKQREVFGEFVGGDAVVFNYDSIQDCISGAAEPYDPAYTYVTGIDFGRVGSYTVVTTIKIPINHDAEIPRVVAIERFKGNWDLQKARIKQHVESYGQSFTYIDATGLGDSMEGELRAMGLRHLFPVKISNTIKVQMVNALIAVVEGAGVRWFPHKQLEKELCDFEAQVSQAGSIQYRKPKGANMYDDCVISFALAWWAYLKHGAPQRGEIWACGIG